MKRTKHAMSIKREWQEGRTTYTLWDSGEPRDDGTLGVLLYTRHNPNRKEYEVCACTCTVTEYGYTVAFGFASKGDAMRTLKRTPTGRYSVKKLEEIHAGALYAFVPELFITLADEG